MGDITSIVNSIDSRRCTLIASVVIYTEILLSSLTVEAQKNFQDIFNHSNVHLMAVDHRIAKEAHRIIVYHRKNGQTISSLDALHLATAIIYESDEFHTFDGGRQGKKNVPLLALNGNVAGRNLIIKKPSLDMGVFTAVSENVTQ
jgi:predicted nucleic acid-binding protein